MNYKLTSNQFKSVVVAFLILTGVSIPSSVFAKYIEESVSDFRSNGFQEHIAQGMRKVHYHDQERGIKIELQIPNDYSFIRYRGDAYILSPEEFSKFQSQGSNYSPRGIRVRLRTDSELTYLTPPAEPFLEETNQAGDTDYPAEFYQVESHMLSAINSPQNNRVSPHSYSQANDLKVGILWGGPSVELVFNQAYIDEAVAILGSLTYQ